MDVLLIMAIAACVALSLAGRSLPGRGPAALYGGLFAHPYDLGWPVGVQEEYDPAWGRTAARSGSVQDRAPARALVDQPVHEPVDELVIEDVPLGARLPVLTRVR
jgi:hypothetical protein